jgi:hypothetical protein
MLVAAAFVPAAPVLVPSIAGGAAAELDDFRAQCEAAVRIVCDAAPDQLVMLGAAPRTAPYAADAVADLAPWGGDPIGAAADAPRLPLSLAMGSWWLDRVAGSTPRVSFGLAADDPLERCRSVGEALAERATSVGVLAIGGGSACRTDKAPGSFDARAEAFDEALVGALGSADIDALLAVDDTIAAELLVDGRAPWQVVAAMAAARPAGSGDCVATLHGTADPYGVQYVAASWQWTP